MIFAMTRRISAPVLPSAASCTGKALPGGIRGKCGSIDVSYGSRLTLRARPWLLAAHERAAEPGFS